MNVEVKQDAEFDYQSDRHCAKILSDAILTACKFDYQSDRHCAKTGKASDEEAKAAILKKMAEHSEEHFDEAYLIGHDSSLTHLKK